jgi:hypothetical protein
MKMQLTQNNFSIAKNPPAYSAAQQRQGIVLNAPLPQVLFITNDIILAFNRFLKKSGLVGSTYHEVGIGENGKMTILPRSQYGRPIFLAKFCSDLDQSMRLLCEEGPIEFLALKGWFGRTAHSHTVSLKPSVNNEVVYSIGAKDRETPRVRRGGMIPDNLDILLESYAQVDPAGNEIFNPNKSRFRHVQNGEVFDEFNDGWGSPDPFKFPLKHFYEVSQNPERAIVKLRGRQLANLERDLRQLPSGVIKGLNQISDALRQFDPNDEYIIRNC